MKDQELMYCILIIVKPLTVFLIKKLIERLKRLEMWANAQRDGRPAEHRWRPLFTAAKFG